MARKRQGRSYIPDYEKEELEIEFCPQVEVLRRNRKTIIYALNPNILCVHLRCLTIFDAEKIHAKCTTDGPISASLLLANLLIRKNNFWEEFIEVLKHEQIKLDHIAELLENDMIKYKEEKENQLLTEKKEQSVSTETEVPEEPPSKSIKVDGSVGKINISETASIHHIRKKIERLELTDEKQPRRYQCHLAHLATKGHNTIICAPPGSGKTMVGLLICKAHLEKNSNKAEFERGHADENTATEVAEKGTDVRIVIVVPRHAILMQWYRECKNMFPFFQITTRSGASHKDNVPLDIALKVHDILIATAEIFKNALIDDNTADITSTTLIIFDECHHTVEDHPYNMIMSSYMKVKFNEPQKALPQIIGLSASPGAGRKTLYAAAEKKIMQLCANLDTEFIVTVPAEFQDEIDKHSPHSMRHMKFARQRPNNPFSLKINTTMVNIENHIGMRNVEENDRGKPEYNPKIDKILEKARSEDNDVMRKCGEHLFEYNKVLALIDLVKLDEGIKQLDKFYNSFEERNSCGQLDKTETFLLEMYNGMKDNLQQFAADEQKYPSPKLDELTTNVIKLYQKCKENDQEFRGIISVETRILAESLKESLLAVNQIQEMNPKVYVSVNKSRDSGSSMSKTEQDEILDDFKIGKVKLLISTSILDEGVDVEYCNMTVIYSRITNAITMVQCDGRARSKNSVNLSIGGTKIVEKNEVNLLLVQFMEQAVQNIQKLQQSDTEFYKKEIESIQKKDVNRREMKAKGISLLQSQHTPDEIEFRCKSCETVVCKASDIRVMDGSNYVNISDEFRKLVEFREHNDPKKKEFGTQKICCNKCKNDWGNTANSYPCLKVKSFVILVKGQVRKVKQWKHMPCKITPFGSD